MNSSLSANAYRPLQTYNSQTESEVDGAQVQEEGAPSAARLQRAWTNSRYILTAAQVMGMASAAVFGVGTGSGDHTHLIAGGAGLFASAVTQLAVLRRIPETYELADHFGDNRLVTVVGTITTVVIWAFATVVTIPKSLKQT